MALKSPDGSSENTLEVKLELINNYELVSLILSFADSVKVVSPPGLSEIVKGRLTTALKHY